MLFDIHSSGCFADSLPGFVDIGDFRRHECSPHHEVLCYGNKRGVDENERLPHYRRLTGKHRMSPLATAERNSLYTDLIVLTLPGNAYLVLLPASRCFVNYSLKLTYSFGELFRCWIRLTHG